VYYVRYADDFVLMFQHGWEAKEVLEELKARLGKFGLEVAEDKTRVLPFGRCEGTPDRFDFLGFTYFNSKTKEGKYRLGVQTSKKRLRAKEQAVKKWLRSRRTKPLKETMETIRSALIGHNNYYGINGNAKVVGNFYDYVKCACHRMLNKRGQKGKYRWDKFIRIWDFYVRKPRVTVNIWNWKPMPA